MHPFEGSDAQPAELELVVRETGHTHTAGGAAVNSSRLHSLTKATANVADAVAKIDVGGVIDAVKIDTESSTRSFRLVPTVRKGPQLAYAGLQRQRNLWIAKIRLAAGLTLD